MQADKHDEKSAHKQKDEQAGDGEVARAITAGLDKIAVALDRIAKAVEGQQQVQHVATQPPSATSIRKE